MKIRMTKILVLCLTLTGLITSAEAAPVQLNIEAMITHVEGDYAASLSVGQILEGTFVFDTDEGNASGAETTPSTEPGHEFSSFYDFSGPPYEVSISGPAPFPTFHNSAPVGVVVNDNLALTSAETNGVLVDGSYDWIEILGSTTSDIAGPHTPGNGDEWTLALFGNTDWISDGSLIPDDLGAFHSSLLVGIKFNASGDESGIVFASLNGMSVSAVPLPPAVWLFGVGLIGLAGVAKRSKAKLADC